MRHVWLYAWDGMMAAIRVLERKREVQRRSNFLNMSCIQWASRMSNIPYGNWLCWCCTRPLLLLFVRNTQTVMLYSHLHALTTKIENNSAKNKNKSQKQTTINTWTRHLRSMYCTVPYSTVQWAQRARDTELNMCISFKFVHKNYRTHRIPCVPFHLKWNSQWIKAIQLSHLAFSCSCSFARSPSFSPHPT